MNINIKAKYHGGHLLHPISDRPQEGKLILTKNSIKFRFGEWKDEISFSEIDWENVSYSKGEDEEYKNKTAAWSFFATGLPVSSYSKTINFLVISYMDENDVEQKPTVSVEKPEDLKGLSQILYAGKAGEDVEGEVKTLLEKKEKKEKKKQEKKDKIKGMVGAVVGFIFSFLPGLGHIFTGKFLKGIVILIVFFLLEGIIISYLKNNLIFGVLYLGFLFYCWYDLLLKGKI